MASFQGTGNCRCLFCWDVFVESDLGLSPDLGKFLKCLGCYLGVLKWRDKEEEAIDFGGNGGNVGVDTCQGCGRMIMRFVELFGELCRIRLEIDAGLEVLVGKMRGIEAMEEDDQGKWLESVMKLRAEIRDKCFEKVSKAQAKVCLEKLQTAKLEVGAGVMEKGLENEDDSDDHSTLDNCHFDVDSDEESGSELEAKFCSEESDREKGDQKDMEWKPDSVTGSPPTQQKFKCQFCFQKPYNTKFKSNLIRHYRTSHSMNLDKAHRAFKTRNLTVQKDVRTESKVEYPPMFSCTRCSTLITRKGGLIRHYREKHSMTLDEAKMTFETEKPALVERTWITKEIGFQKDTKSEKAAKYFKPEEKPAFPCSVPSCKTILSTSLELEKHGQLHGSFSCIFCPEVKTFAPDLAVHELEAHSESPQHENKCTRCAFSSPSLTTYITHHVEIHQDLTYKIRNCPICQTNFLGNLRNHNNTHHGNLTPDDPNAKKCNHEGCSAYFLKVGQLLLHKRRVHGVDHRKICPDCGKIFSSIGNMHTHRRMQHGYDDENPAFPNGCQVPGCKKRFASLEELSSHKEFCYPAKYAVELVQCPECNRSCKGSDGLRRHMKSHKRRFICEICGKEFDKKCILVLHYNFHKSPEEWEHQCQQCGKKCQTIYLLRQHMRVHSGEKPWLCQRCGNRYACKNKWKKHLEGIHGVEVPTRKITKPKSISKREPIQR